MSDDFEKILYHDVIESIIAAMEAKDYHTADHSRRVGDMVLELCPLLGLSIKDTEEIHLAAHVHDIGKIGVPDYILSKPGPLSEMEWSIMKMHPVTGADILSHSSALEYISKIVKHHHERWDGKGYPLGLAGEKIPYGSRIITVCDSIDAMLSNRAYRSALTSQECKEEIRKNIEIMYDRSIAECVLSNWEYIVEGRKHNADNK
ncbi:MAG: HD domain-containing protein [Lachnospiraceae bacterium]|nr:HD domain-containing protein [Lachnospiraceae bacterium]